MLLLVNMIYRFSICLCINLLEIIDFNYNCMFFVVCHNYDTIHIILNSLQALVVFSSISIWLFLGEKHNSINKVILLILLISVLVAGFHSLTLIDYDFRYRFPIIMPLIIIFPISCEIFLRKILYKNFRY